MKKPFQIEALKKTLQGRLSGSPVSLAYLYGSYASGTFTDRSDIDIALVFREKIDNRNALKYELNLAVWLDDKFKAEFDVRNITNAPLKIQGEVVTHGILLYSSDEDFRIKYEVRIRNRYFDFLPSLRTMQKIFFQSIKERGLLDTTTNH
ncbi:MAG: nucleotidyltransferase domain-containing protein [Candidatus Aminicenantes bacterium]